MIRYATVTTRFPDHSGHTAQARVSPMLAGDSSKSGARARARAAFGAISIFTAISVTYLVRWRATPDSDDHYVYAIALHSTG